MIAGHGHDDPGPGGRPDPIVDAVVGPAEDEWVP
ncbi:UNVERIFIED_CONTAM: hypothetical protein DES50_103376 [Williamsia faeni]